MTADPPGRRPRAAAAWLRRVALELVLWAAPLGVALGVVVLLANASAFHHGPGVPTAGDPRAWAALWGALLLVVAGGIVGLLSNAVWLVLALRARRPIRLLDWVRLSAGALLGAGLALIVRGT